MRARLVVLLLLSMSFSCVLMLGASGEEIWTLMGEDPLSDVWKFGDHGIGVGGNSLGPPDGDMPYLDVVALHMSSNETMVFPRLEVLGEVVDAPNVYYSVVLCEVRFPDDSPFVRVELRTASYSDGIATFNETEIPYDIEGGNVTFHIPLALAEAEQCLVDRRIDLFTAEARERHEDCNDPDMHGVPDCYFGDRLEFWTHQSYFFDDTLEDNIPPVAVIDQISPDPATEGEFVFFLGHGIDEDGNATDRCLWFSRLKDRYDSFSSECAVETDELEGGEHVIIFRVRDDVGAWAETRATLWVEPLNEPDPYGHEAPDLAPSIALSLTIMLLLLAALVVALVVWSQRDLPR